MPPDPIDALMERASSALARTDYFECAELAETALRRAHQRRDFERLARICMPLQEARRNIRLQALESPGASILDRRPRGLEAGRHLVQPPLLGIDGTRLQHDALRRRIPAIVLTREPMTLDGRWPVVAVAEKSYRARLAPPVPGRRIEGVPTWDEPLEGAWETPPPRWFAGALDALGEVAIAGLHPEDHPVFKVEDLLDALDALPLHERLPQVLASVAMEAFRSPPPEEGRRPLRDDPFVF